MLLETADATSDSLRGGALERPGVIAVFSGVGSIFLPFAVDGAALRIGRAGEVGSLLGDDRLSREHAEISFAAGAWVVRDLGSRNGTFVDGERIEGEVRVASPRVIRAADTVLIPCPDVTHARRPSVAADGTIVGSKLRAALDLIERGAKSAETLLILGESGTGKELAARTFHEHGPNARGPFVAVNCAAIPEGLAERLLLGAKRGAYSGAATDATGHVEAADGGVLFLDEGGELDLQVQAKLLRVLETREVVPLGASHGKRVSIRVCIATHRDLRSLVAAGRFRADLYHRIAPPEVVLPPLRERLDEVACHVIEEIARSAPGMSPQAKLLEVCLLRQWPGNVRELRKQLRHAALGAAAQGADRVRAEHLPSSAGQPLAPAPDTRPPGPPEPQAGPAPRRYTRWSSTLTREDLERALAENGGNVAIAARSMGMQRSQLYREMERLSVDPTKLRPPRK